MRPKPIIVALDTPPVSAVVLFRTHKPPAVVLPLPLGSVEFAGMRSERDLVVIRNGTVEFYDAETGICTGSVDVPVATKWFGAVMTRDGSAVVRISSTIAVFDFARSSCVEYWAATWRTGEPSSAKLLTIEEINRERATPDTRAAFEREVRGGNIAWLRFLGSCSVRECEDGLFECGLAASDHDRQSLPPWLRVCTIAMFDLRRGQISLERRETKVAIEAQPSLEMEVRATATALAQGAVDAQTMKRIELRDLSAAACAEAIDRMAEVVSTELDQLVTADTVRFLMMTSQGPLTEKQFFRHIVSQGLPVGQKLHGLLATLCDQWRRRSNGGNHDLWHDGVEGVEALGYALDALIELHPDAIEVVDPYFDLSDHDHAGFTTHEIAPKFFVSIKNWTERHRFVALRQLDTFRSDAIGNALLEHVATDSAASQFARTIALYAQSWRSREFDQLLDLMRRESVGHGIAEAKLVEIATASMESIDHYIAATIGLLNDSHPVKGQVIAEFPHLAPHAPRPNVG